jgi:hypothetical protein
MNYKKDVEKMQTEINKTIKLLYSLNDMGTQRTYGTQARNLTKKLNSTINEFKNRTKIWDEEYKKSIKNEKNIIESVENIKKTSKKQHGGEIENKIIMNVKNDKNVNISVENIKKIPIKQYGGETENKGNNRMNEIKNLIDSLNVNDY